ncbi:hypothetical protein [Oryzihumus leptocrescens]|uniref:Uncharacterized protein n=1 Tax=Oryzihumus leptocrescens TaxID=297536 RepID=A0A542ZNG9_9MICO|nr:hypothetical protein [Oryzihumus leptocrescens]TQL61893.1 hypothetical protein FB474_3314 [Oryzihumus leptocrescens]
MGLTAVAAYVVGGGPPPGGLGLVPLDIQQVRPSAIVVPGLIVADARGEPLLSGEDDLRSDPGRGGGPLTGPTLDAGARAFALTNVAACARRLLDRVEAELDTTLPPLRILVGCHEVGPQRWGGGHYRLPASSYSELPEVAPVDPAGEVHLGSGRLYVEHAGSRYLHAPGHNVAVVTHEVAHHVCRHVADFRLNRLRPPQDQTNRRTAVEEGTCDYLAAAMLGHPDIYGWHRGHIPLSDPRRRCLASHRTMTDFRGGHDADPHADGSIWASALWDARSHADRAGHPAESVDGVLLRGLARLGQDDTNDRGPEARRARKYYGTLLSAMLEVSRDDALTAHLEGVMSARGIYAGWSNARAREAARRCA